MKVGTDSVLLGAWANIVQAASILDIGSGSGVLALMSAQRNNVASIDAIEIDRAAFYQSIENIKRSNWSARISNIHSAIQDYSKENTIKSYDSIISNPPYYESGSNTKIVNKPRSTARSTESLTFGELQDSVKGLLKEGGNFSLILPIQEGDDFIKMALEKGYYLSRQTEVIPRDGKSANRMLLELVLKPKETIFTTFTIRKKGNKQRDYTDEFSEMHKEFYLFL